MHVVIGILAGLFSGIGLGYGFRGKEAKAIIGLEIEARKFANDFEHPVTTLKAILHKL